MSMNVCKFEIYAELYNSYHLKKTFSVTCHNLYART